MSKQNQQYKSLNQLWKNSGSILSFKQYAEEYNKDQNKTHFFNAGGANLSETSREIIIEDDGKNIDDVEMIKRTMVAPESATDVKNDKHHQPLLFAFGVCVGVVSMLLILKNKK